MPEEGRTITEIILQGIKNLQVSNRGLTLCAALTLEATEQVQSDSLVSQRPFLYFNRHRSSIGLACARLWRIAAIAHLAMPTRRSNSEQIISSDNMSCPLDSKTSTLASFLNSRPAKTDVTYEEQLEQHLTRLADRISDASDTLAKDVTQNTLAIGKAMTDMTHLMRKPGGSSSERREGGGGGGGSTGSVCMYFIFLFF